MLYATIASILLVGQVPPTGGAPPAQQGNNQLPPRQHQTPGNIQQPSNGGQNVMADGTYQVLAYEKFGQVLPGMNTLKVAIRNNILIFPGDGKLPGKMIQLAFGPNNTVTLTPIDGRINTTQATNVPQGSTGQNPVGGSAVNSVNNSEWGVYVLSTEFFSISVVGGQPENFTGIGPIANQGLPPGNMQGNPANPPVVPSNPAVGGTGAGGTAAGAKGRAPMQKGGIIFNPKTGGTDAPNQPGFPPTQPGGQKPPTVPGSGQTQGGVIYDPRTGGTDAPGQPGFPPNQPGTQPPGNSGTAQSAVLVLRKVTN